MRNNCSTARTKSTVHPSVYWRNPLHEFDALVIPRSAGERLVQGLVVARHSMQEVHEREAVHLCTVHAHTNNCPQLLFCFQWFQQSRHSGEGMRLVHKAFLCALVEHIRGIADSYPHLVRNRHALQWTEIRQPA